MRRALRLAVDRGLVCRQLGCSGPHHGAALRHHEALVVAREGAVVLQHTPILPALSAHFTAERGRSAAGVAQPQPLDRHVLRVATAAPVDLGVQRVRCEILQKVQVVLLALTRRSRSRQKKRVVVKHIVRDVVSC